MEKMSRKDLEETNNNLKNENSYLQKEISDIKSNYVNLLIENNELQKDYSDLRAEYKREIEKMQKHTKVFYERKKVSKRVSLAAGTFLSIVSITAGAAFSNLMSTLNKINYGKNELENCVQNECLDGITWIDDQIYGLVFHIDKKSVSYDYAMRTIKSRAFSSGISDIDLYIGMKEIFNSDVASYIVPNIEKEDIDQRCIEVYLEDELERVKSDGR